MGHCAERTKHLIAWGEQNCQVLTQYAKLVHTGLGIIRSNLQEEVTKQMTRRNTTHSACSDAILTKQHQRQLTPETRLASAGNVLDRASCFHAYRSPCLQLDMVGYMITQIHNRLMRQQHPDHVNLPDPDAKVTAVNM